MTQEDKELLLKDLCARLPYGVKVNVGEDMAFTLKEINENGLCEASSKSRMTCYTKLPLPYLRPMLSMTDEEKEGMHKLLSPEGTAIYGCGGISMPMNHYGEFVSYEFMNRIIQYLLKHHFDFMGLIPKDLAIEVVTESNNPYKE